MPLPKPPSKMPPKNPAKAQPPATAVPKSDVVFTDDYGVEYLGSEAKITVSADLRLSRNYHSAGINVGFEFRTPISKADSAITNAQAKLRSLLREELTKVSDVLTDAIVHSRSQE